MPTSLSKISVWRTTTPIPSSGTRMPVSLLETRLGTAPPGVPNGGGLAEPITPRTVRMPTVLSSMSLSTTVATRPVPGNADQAASDRVDRDHRRDVRRQTDAKLAAAGECVLIDDIHAVAVELYRGELVLEIATADDVARGVVRIVAKNPQSVARAGERAVVEQVVVRVVNRDIHPRAGEVDEIEHVVVRIVERQPRTGAEHVEPMKCVRVGILKLDSREGAAGDAAEVERAAVGRLDDSARRVGSRVEDNDVVRPQVVGVEHALQRRFRLAGAEAIVGVAPRAEGVVAYAAIHRVGRVDVEHPCLARPARLDRQLVVVQIAVAVDADEVVARGQIFENRHVAVHRRPCLSASFRPPAL